MLRTGRRVLSFAVAAALTLSPGLGRAQEAPGDGGLSQGIRQAQEGEFETALTTLSGVVRQLSAQPGRKRDLARAYTYLAVAYLGLAQQETAKAKLIEALKADGSLALSLNEFPPRFVLLFEEAKAQAGPSGPPPAPQAAPVPATKKKGGKRIGLVVLGVGAATGVVLATRGKKTAEPPAACTPGQFDLVNTRFDPSGFRCPVGRSVVPLEIMMDAVNRSSVPVTVFTAQAGTTCVAACPTCTCFPARIDPRPFSPTTLGPGQGTLRLTIADTTCEVPDRDTVGFMDLSGTVRVETSCGSFSLSTSNAFHYSWP